MAGAGGSPLMSHDKQEVEKVVEERTGAAVLVVAEEKTATHTSLASGGKRQQGQQGQQRQQHAKKRRQHRKFEQGQQSATVSASSAIAIRHPMPDGSGSGVSSHISGRLHVLLGVTGSVASVKVPALVSSLQQLLIADGRGVDVAVVSTEHARHFFDIAAVAGPLCRVWADADEWASFARLGDPVLHIELRKWADLLVLAPLDANTLAKLANGISDNLLTCVARVCGWLAGTCM